MSKPQNLPNRPKPHYPPDIPRTVQAPLPGWPDTLPKIRPIKRRRARRQGRRPSTPREGPSND